MNKKIDAAVAGFGTACFMLSMVLSAYIARITLADAHIRFATGIEGLLIGSFVLWGILGIVALKNLLYQDVKYPPGAYVSTTDEYNSTFNESFSGHIIARGREGITVRNDKGDERVLYERWIKVGGA